MLEHSDRQNRSHQPNTVDNNKLLVTADPPLAQLVSLRPTTASSPWSSPKINTKIGSATEESVLPPKTNNKTCIGTMHFIFVSPLLLHRIPSPPTRRTEKGHVGAFQTFSLCRWGGNGLTIRQNPHSFSLLPPEKDQVCHQAYAIDIRLPPGKQLHRQQAMEMRELEPYVIDIRLPPGKRLHRQQAMEMREPSG